MNYETTLTGIVIDAGHGGVDSGAVGNGIIEKDLNLLISQYMYNRFKELGIPVALTRNEDKTLDATDRPGVALNQFGNNQDIILLSNHINAGGGEGAEVIYALRNNDTLARNIISELNKEGQVIRKFYQRRLPSDSSKDYYFMLRNTPNTEALIIEYGFLDNVKDANRLKNNYENYAEAVVRAVTNYKNLNYVPPFGNDYYIVKKGDTLWSVANKNSTTVNDLKSLNNLTNNTLSIGDILKLPTNEEIIKDEYIVQKGDTLYGISKKTNITVDEIKRINNLNDNTLSIGQVLLLKEKPNVQNIYVVKKGDTLYSIANKNNTTIDKLKELNNLSTNTLSINQELIIPDNIETYTYTVAKGDTLYSISKKFNTTVSNIRDKNNLTSDALSIGQELLI